MGVLHFAIPLRLNGKVRARTRPERRNDPRGRIANGLRSFHLSILGASDMNLVEQIKQQLSSAVIGQLSSVLGSSEASTGTALTAAVPALLSALSSLASSGSGAQKLISALSQLGTGSMDNLTHKLANQPGAVQEQGNNLLSSLFGAGTISAIVNAVSRFANIPPGPTQKLISFVAPIILSSIASKFAGKSMSTQGLASLFADEKANIASALPSGLSLSDVPGLAAAGTAVRSAAHEVEAAGSSMARWLLPLAGVAVLGLVAWMFWQSSATPVPEEKAPTVTRAQSPDTPPASVPDRVKALAPDVNKLKTDITDTFTKATEALTGVKDAATAEAAMPKLQDLDGKLEDAKTAMKTLAEAGQTIIKTLAKSQLSKIKEIADKVLAFPGVGEKIKPVVDSIMAKLTDLST
jgi:hypothetical protein